MNLQKKKKRKEKERILCYIISTSSLLETTLLLITPCKNPQNHSLLFFFLHTHITSSLNPFSSFLKTYPKTNLLSLSLSLLPWSLPGLLQQPSDWSPCFHLCLIIVFSQHWSHLILLNLKPTQNHLMAPHLSQVKCHRPMIFYCLSDFIFYFYLSCCLYFRCNCWHWIHRLPQVFPLPATFA